MNNKNINDKLIQDLADSIRYLIETETFYHNICQHLRETGEFPSEIKEQILDQLFSKGAESERIVNDYLTVINHQDASELYQLHFDIFSTQLKSSSSSSSFNIGDEDDEANDSYYKEENGNNDEVTTSTPKNQNLLPTISLAQLGEIQEKSITFISNKFNIHPEISEIFLQIHHFDQDAISKEITVNISKCRETIGLKDHDLKLPIHFKRHNNISSNESCQICYNDEESGAVLYSLPCKHFFCKTCITEHINYQVSKCQYEIRCPYSDCQCRIVQRDVQKFCGAEIATKYFNTIIESQIAMSDNLHHCAREGCPNILTNASVGLGFIATCQVCNCQMCWKCGEKSHAPLSCDLVSKWGEISKEENAELKWIKDNTKACPQCHERIERNGGCTYIKCPKCKYEFCYVCGGPFPAHKNHNPWCSAYRDYDNLKMPNSIDVGRLSFYLTRYLANKVSHENEVKQRDLRQSQLLNNFVFFYDVPSDRLSMNDAMKLTNDIFNTIDEARSILIWSYPHAFFMKPLSKELGLFEHVQMNLTIALEDLANLVENKQFESPKTFKKTMTNVKSYTKSLLLHVYN